jgi:hypothetical protein
MKKFFAILTSILTGGAIITAISSIPLIAEAGMSRN